MGCVAGVLYLLAESDIIAVNESATFFDPHNLWYALAASRANENGSTCTTR